MATGDRVDPYAQYNFLVEIDGITRAGFTEVGGLDTEQDIIEYREGGDTATKRKLPGLRKYSNITLKRGFTADKRALVSGAKLPSTAPPSGAPAPSSCWMKDATRCCAGTSSRAGSASGRVPASTPAPTKPLSNPWRSPTKVSNWSKIRFNRRATIDMYTTPGVYFEQIDRGRPAIGPLRTDIAAFAGYTERGPLLQPLKLTNWRQFLSVFGSPPAFAHLPYAVQGFFANGGAACYVVRIAGRTPAAGAAAAGVVIDDRQDPAAAQPILRFFASHGQLFDPVTQGPLIRDGRPLRVDSPGAWGNRLALSLYDAGLGRSTTIPGPDLPAGGLVTPVTNLSGFEVGSIVRISQGSTVLSQLRLVAAIDAAQRQLVWDRPLPAAGIDWTMPIQLATVEFSVQLMLDGQVVERHENLSLSPRHSRFVVPVVQANSSWIDVQVILATGDAVQPAPATLSAQRLEREALEPRRWPRTVDRLPFSAGRDGLVTVTKDDFLTGLAALEAIDEISLLAAPDAVLNIGAPAALPGAAHTACQLRRTESAQRTAARPGA